MSIQIKYRQGNTEYVRCEVEVSDKAIYRKELMTEEYVLLTFNTTKDVGLRKGDYIDTEFGRFRLVNIKKPKLDVSGAGGYCYEQKFHAPWEQWRKRKLFYSRQRGSEKAWSMTQKPEYFMQIVIDNLLAAGFGKYSAVIDSDLTEMKLVQFDGDDIISGLTKIAEAWYTEWWMAGNVIHLSKCEYGTPVRFEIGDLINDMEPSDGQQNDYVTRLYAFGATRNIPTNYRESEDSDSVIEGVVERRLKLPEGTNYVDAWPDLKDEDVVEGIAIFDKVYPRRTGEITSDVWTEKYVDEVADDSSADTELVEWNAYRFRDSGITFKEKYILPDQELRITFQTGALAGMDFAVKFNPDGADESSAAAQVWEVVRNDSYGINLPNDKFHPAKGDTYILYGYDTKMVSDLLIPKAEEELLEEAKKLVAKKSVDSSVYNCPTNPIRCAGYTESDGALVYDYMKVVDLDVGQSVELRNDTYFSDSDGYRISRVRAFEKKLDNRFNCTYEIGETASYSKSKELDDKMENLSVQTSRVFQMGGGVYLIKRYDSSSPTDHNAFSAVRSLYEFVSKTKDDRTPYKMSTDKAFEVGKYVPGASGGIFGMDEETGDSFADVARLYVRVRAFFEELTVIKAGVLAGKQYITPGGGVRCTKVEEVKDANGAVTAYRCYFLSEQDGEKTETKIIAGDQAISEMFNAKAGTSNKVSNHRYWRLVTAVDNDAYTDDSGNHYGYIELSATDCEKDSDIPQADDEICQLGNRDDATRQAAMVFSTVDADAPSLRLYSGINSYSLADKAVISFGKDPLSGQIFFRLGSSSARHYLDYTQDGGLRVAGSISSLSTLDDGTTLGDAIGGKIEDTDVLYITHTSATSAPALPTLKPDGTIANYNGWQTTAPTWQQGRYIWQTTYVRKGNGTAYFAATACISGRDGAGYSNNLLRNSDFRDGARHFTASSHVVADTTKIFEGRNSIKVTASGYTSNPYHSWCYREDDNGALYMDAKPGDVYTLSAWVYADDIAAIDKGTLMALYFCDANGRILGNEISPTPTTNGEWQYFKVISRVAPAGTTKVEFRAGIVRNGTIWFNGIKAEYGANPNPVWTPYAEGVGIASITEQYYLSTSRTALTGGSWSDTRQPWVAGRYYWTRSKITYTDGKVTYTDGVCVTGEAGTSVLVRYSADGNTGWHTSPLPDDRYMQTSTDGGSTWSPAYLISASGYTNNLLQNSNFKDGLSHWNNWGTPTTREIVTSDGKKWLHLVTTTAAYQGIFQPRIKANSSTKYTFSARVRGATDGQQVSALVHFTTTSHVPGTTVPQSKAEWVADTDEQIVRWTFETPADATAMSLNVGRIKSVLSEIYITDLKLEEGDNPTPVWTPAASEMQGGYPVFQWAKNSDASTAPTSGWQNTPLTALPGEYVWIRTGVVIPPATVPAAWDPAVRLTGDHGADGSDVYRLDLSNEMAGVVCDADGNVTGAYPACTAKVYKGATLLTSGVTYSIPQKTGITTATISTAGVITLGGLTADKAEITVRAVTAGLTLESVMTVYKVKPGKDGDSVKVSSTSVTYQASANGTNTPTGTWLSAIPTVPAGQYLWTRTIVTYSDGKSSTTYSVSRQGADGQKYTNNLLRNSDFKDGTRFYQLDANVTLDTSRVLDGRYSVKSSQSGSTTQTYAGLTYHDTGKTGDFYPAKPGDVFTFSLWTYTDDRDALNEGGCMEIWFHDASGRVRGTSRSAECKPTANGVWQHFHCISAVAPEGTISVELRAHVRRDGTLWFNGMKAEYGSNDKPVWTPYAEGVTIASKSVTYAKTTTATQPADSAFTLTSPGTLTQGQWLWTRTTVSYSDGSETKSYTAAYIGTDGSNGLPGAAGADGKTTYVHFAYASGITGSLPHPASVTDFQTTAFTGAKYIGVCTDYNQADPITNVGNTYEWSEYKGADAEVYQIEPSADKVVRDFDGTLSPTSLTCSVYKTTGATARTLTAEKTLKYRRLPDGLSGTLAHSSGASPAVPLLADTEEVVFELYDGTTLLDRERVPVLTDARDIELGGQNLLKNTNRGPMGWQTSVWSADATAEQTGVIKAATAPDGKGVLMTLDGGLNEDGTALYDPMHTTYQAQYAVPAGTLEGGRRYALSLLIGAVTGPAYLEVSLNRKGFSSVRVNYLTTITAPTSPDEIVRLEIPFTTPSGTALTSGEVTDEAFYKEKDLGITVYIRPKNATSVWQSFTVRDMQLERGNVATAYRPHINDTSYLVEALPGQTKFNGGLGLTSRILLGEFDTTDPDNPVLETIRAGINGVMMPNERGGGLVWWGGGSPKDAADYSGDDDTATSATRMDGTAYFAGNTVRFGKNFAEIGDSLRLDDDGLKLIKDNETRLRVTDVSVENFAQPTQEAVITIPAVTLGFRFAVDLDDNAYGPHVLRAITGGEHITLGGGREVPANSAFDLGLSFELNAPQATFIPQFEVYVDLYNSAGTLVSRTMCEQTRSESTPAGITIRFTASVHTTLPKGSYWMRLWRGSANLPDEGAMLPLPAPVAVAGGITPGLKNCTILAPDGFLTTWNQAVILAKKDSIMLRVGSSSVIINDSMCNLISHNYGFRVSKWGIMKTTAYDPNNDGANWVITDK